MQNVFIQSVNQWCLLPGASRRVWRPDVHPRDLPLSQLPRGDPLPAHLPHHLPPQLQQRQRDQGQEGLADHELIALHGPGLQQPGTGTHAWEVK